MNLDEPGIRIGVFGGSFDPPHLGHALGCLWALESGEVDAVLLVPVARHPFGKEPEASFAHRMEMCRLATERLRGWVEVSGLEAERPGASYTIDTLRELMGRYPGASFRVIVGSDVATDVPRWHEGEKVLELAPLLELPRPSPDGESPAGALPDVSSSGVREAIAAGGSLSGLLARPVQDYISRNGLYRPSSAKDTRS